MSNFFNLIGGLLAGHDFIKLTNFINKVLYTIDPMSTGCVENDLQDEYIYEAEEIAKLIMCGFPMTFAVKTVFDSRFFDDCLSEDSLNNVCLSISNNY